MCFTARITGCTDVRFEHILVDGYRNEPGGCSEAAFVVENSKVQLIDSEIRGGFGGTGSGSLVLSGAVLTPALQPHGLTVSAPAPAQPFARLTGDFALGGQAQLDTFGPAAATHWLFLSIAPTTFALPAKVDGPIGLDLAGFPLKLLVRTTNGQDSPDSLMLPIPDLGGLENLPLVMQSFAPGQSLNAPYLALNPTHLVILPAP